MSKQVFKTRKNVLLNVLLLVILLFTLILFLIFSARHPALLFAFIPVLIVFPLLGYILLAYNRINLTISKDSLLIKWFGGSNEIQLKNIIGYYDYTVPLFEIHFQSNIVGAKLTRNDIGQFYYCSPGIRKGLMIEYKKEFQVERVFIVPKAKESFIGFLRVTLMESYNKKLEEKNNKFFIK